ncbi:hypothetical protein JQC67_09140 [Aurantibacter crassamenti]|uniref:hypothetical protein n=1 Tax=Aurantibacter crassamenti TaxID=1837375 RepID=UPI0019397873|nr:hypothetical protein [Aurantibacter crassamenti]MBM1106298.1 hypothetical protein [Aurantibacter crassamenti]
MSVHHIKIKYILIALLFMGFNTLYAQIEVAEDVGSSLVSDVGLENLQSVSKVQSNLPQATANSVYIQQIGSNNNSSIHSQSGYSEINLVQNGNSNSADINVAAKTLNQNVLQNGNNNFLLEYGNTSGLNLERNIIQDGNNQGVVIFGSNTLTEKIQLNLQGNAKSITIRNFN